MLCQPNILEGTAVLNLCSAEIGSVTNVTPCSYAIKNKGKTNNNIELIQSMKQIRHQK